MKKVGSRLRAQQGTAAERRHLRRSATGGGVIQSIVVQPFTPSARAVTAVPPVGRSYFQPHMGLRDFLKSLFATRPDPVSDPMFGPIEDYNGSWCSQQCKIKGVANPVHIIVPGDDVGPFDSSRREFQDIVNELPSLSEKVALKFFDWYTRGSGPDETNREPNDVWSFATLSFVGIGSDPSSTPCDFELGYSVEGDLDHTYLARFKDGEIIEFYPDG